jgi:hypothetical protein
MSAIIAVGQDTDDVMQGVTAGVRAGWPSASLLHLIHPWRLSGVLPTCLNAALQPSLL